MATTGAVPDRRRGLNNPGPSAGRVLMPKQPNAQTVRGGTGNSRFLPRTNKPAR